MLAAIYNRVSTEKQQQEGLSLQTQREACIKYAKQSGYDVSDEYILDEVYSGLTLDRPDLKKLLGWVKSGEVQAIVIYSTDRFSRDGYDLLTLFKECDIYKAKLLCVTEDLGVGKIGELLNFVRGWASGLEATRIKDRAKRGARAAAERGDIASGYGRYGGYYGFKYDKRIKEFIPIPEQLDIIKEIIERCISGESSTSIARDLQKRRITSTSHKIFTRFAVIRVLKNARVYAGIVKWNEIEIRGKIEPIISEEMANTIQQKLRLNREHSFGFGRRSWFSGRVYCGWCGRRYNISKYGCRCNGADNRRLDRCESPKIAYKKLELLLVKALLFAYSDEEVVVTRAKEAHQNWQKEMEELEGRKSRLEHELSIIKERRQRILTQHEWSEITDEKAKDRLKEARIRQNEILDAISDIQTLGSKKVVPADPEQVRAGFNWLKRLDEQEPLLVLLSNSPERHKLGDKLADILNFKATVLPDKKQSFKLEVRINLPLSPIQIEEDNIQEVVLTSVHGSAHDNTLRILIKVNPERKRVENLFIT